MKYIVLCSVLCFSLVVGQRADLPFISLTGTHYEIGYGMGKAFTSRIQQYMSGNPSLKSFIQFYNTDVGGAVYDNFLNRVTDRFSGYVDEIQGIADGAGIPFYQLFLVHMSNELEAILNLTSVQSCSDIFLSSASQCLLGHNEDADPIVDSTGYMVSVNITDSDLKENFTAYHYPGHIAGLAFGFNQWGLVASMNGLYPVDVALHAIPRQFMNRALLSATSYSDIYSLITQGNIAYGFSANLGFVCGPDALGLWNIEIAPNVSVKALSPIFSIKKVNLDHYYHFNVYDRLNVSERAGDSVSSQHRKQRAEQLPVPTDVTGIETILGDTGDTQYPIYRVPSATDDAATVATGIFDLLKKVAVVFRDNPKSASPVFSFDLSRSCSKK